VIIMRKKKIGIKIIINMFSNQKGMALLTTLIFVFVLVTLAVALLTMTNNDTKMSTLQRESNKAFYLADAGIEDTLWKLNTSTEGGGMGVSWRPTNEPAPGTATEYYQVTVVDDGVDDDGDTKVKITSAGSVIGGKFSSGKRKIEVTAEIDYITKTMYDYAVLAEKIILFQGTPGPDVVGDVHSNDDILVSGHFADTYPDDATATCSGDTNEINSDNIDAETVTLPSVNYNTIHDPRDDLEYKASQNGEVHNDNVIVSGEVLEWSGIHYIKGNLEVKNGAGINVTNGAIIVEGKVDVKLGATFNILNDTTYINSDDPSTALALVAQGNIKIYAKSIIKEGIVQSVLADGETAEGFIELKNGCEVTGSVIADTVYLRNKSKITYGTGTSDFTTKGDPFFKKTSWREAY
jgi:hypothetical protein